MKNCKFSFVFPNSLNLHILGLRATKILIRFMLYFELFNFLCNHFVLVSEPKINLNFCKYSEIITIDSSSNIIKFCVYDFDNYVTPRKNFDQKNRAVLHTNIDLNLQLLKRTSRAVNYLNVSETENNWINLVVIGLLILKVFLKHNINIFIRVFFIQLVLSFLILCWSEKRFGHHSKIRLCITKEFFLIESIITCDDLNHENQYLCLQVNCLNPINATKITFSI